MHLLPWQVLLIAAGALLLGLIVSFILQESLFGWLQRLQWPIPLICGVFGLSAAAYLGFQSWHLSSVGRRVEGEVVKVTRELVENGFFYRPTIRYRVDGKVYEVSHFLMTVSSPNSVGESRTVIFDPERPEHAMIASAGHWRGVLVWTIGGTVCIAISIAMWMRRQNLRFEDAYRS